MQNFVRQYSITFFDVDANNNITDVPNVKIQNSLNFSFSYNVTLGIFNVAKFYIYNISESTLELFASKKNRRGFYLRCSYDNADNLKNSLIFRGLTFRVNSYREGPDLITEIIACDVYFNLQQPKIKTLNFKAGVTAREIVQTASNNVGVFNSVSGLDYLNVRPVYKHPLTFTNVPITQIFDMVAADNACVWGFDIAGFKFHPRPNNPDYQSGVISSIPLISRETGLVGNVRAESISAQLFPIDYFSEQRLQNNYPFVTVTTLMRPAPLFSKVNLQCEIKALSGTYIIFAASYQGEYRSNSWYTTMKLTPVVKK